MRELFPHYAIGHFIHQPENRTEFEITSFEDMDEPLLTALLHQIQQV